MKPAGNVQRVMTFTLAFALLFLSACSIRIMYNYLDWIIPFYIDDYVTLTDQQEEIFDRVTVQFLQWHRAEEMPRYERFIVSFKDAQTAPMSREEVLYFFDEAEALWTALLKESLPSLLELSVDLNEKQLREIDDALAEDISELQKKYGNKTGVERREFFRDKVRDALDEWLGNVTVAQEEMILVWSTTRKDTTDGWLQNRDTWRRQFMELLYNRHAPGYRDNMRLFLLQPKNIYSASYRQAVVENRIYFAEFLTDLSITFTPQQRQHLQHELLGVIDDLQELTAANDS